MYLGPSSCYSTARKITQPSDRQVSSGKQTLPKTDSRGETKLVLVTNEVVGVFKSVPDLWQEQQIHPFIAIPIHHQRPSSGGVLENVPKGVPLFIDRR